MASKLELQMHSSIDEVKEDGAADHVEGVRLQDDADPVLEKKVVLKLDLLMMPLLWTMFLFLFLDRGNIGNARVAGMQKSIHVTDSQYQTGQLLPLPQ